MNTDADPRPEPYETLRKLNQRRVRVARLKAEQRERARQVERVLQIQRARNSEPMRRPGRRQD